MPSEEFIQQVRDAKTRIHEVSPAEASQIVREGALLLDIRDADEFEETHLPSARNLAREQLAEKIEEVAPDKSAPIVCYCGGGSRSALAADTLQKLGYTNVHSIAGGLRASLAILPEFR